MIGSSAHDQKGGAMSSRIQVVEETSASLKAQMLRQLRLLGEATSDGWERAVFQTLTGGTREDVDWNCQENYAGYALFDLDDDSPVLDGFSSPRVTGDFARVLEGEVWAPLSSYGVLHLTP